MGICGRKKEAHLHDLFSQKTIELSQDKFSENPCYNKIHDYKVKGFNGTHPIDIGQFIKRDDQYCSP